MFNYINTFELHWIKTQILKRFDIYRRRNNSFIECCKTVTGGIYIARVSMAKPPNLMNANVNAA